MTNVSNNVPRQTTQVVQFVFSIHGVSGFKSVVAHGASVRKRMTAAINHIDRCLTQKRWVELSLPYSEVIAKTKDSGETITRIISGIKQALLRETEEANLPLRLEEYTDNMSTEDFLEKGADTYRGNVELFLKNLELINENAEKFFAERRKALGKEGKLTLNFNDYVPHLYECTGGIFGDDKFHIILSAATIRHIIMPTNTTRHPSPEAQVTEAVQFMCREYVNAIKSFKLTDFVRDPKNRDKYKVSILESDKFFNSVKDVEVKHLNQLFGTPTASALRVMAKGDATMQKASKVIQNESRQLLNDYIMNKCMPRAPYVDPDDATV